MQLKRRLLAGVAAVASIGYGADPALLNMVMADARAAFGINFDRIKASPIGPTVISQMRSANADLETLIGVTGFDPRRDLSEILIASPGGQENPPRVIVAVRGSFDQARLMALARVGGAEFTTYQGIDVAITSKPSPGAMALLDSSVLVLGDLDTVRSTIARRGQPTRLDSALASKIHDLASRFDVWGVTMCPLSGLASSLDASKASGAFSDAMQSIEEFSGGIHVGTKVHVAAELVSRTEKDAGELANVLRFLGAFAQMGSQNPQGKTTAARAAKADVSVEGRTVKFSLLIPQEQLVKTMHTRRPSTPITADRQVPRASAVPVQQAPAKTDITIGSSSKDMGVVVVSPGAQR